MPLPLEGIRVIDWTIWQQGPVASSMLADLGAEVIKVEPPHGCSSRHRGDADGDGVSWHWRAWGRGKHSVVLDLDAAGGPSRLADLLATADVFVESADADQRERWGIDPAAISAAFPGLVHVSVTPFGLTGPRADAPATDMTLAASGGFLNHQGDKDRPPIPIGFPETATTGVCRPRPTPSWPCANATGPVGGSTSTRRCSPPSSAPFCGRVRTP